MTRIKMHISKMKLSFYPPCEIKCGLQNKVSTLRGSLDTCLCFTGASLKLQGYVDADFVGNIDSRKSTTWFVFTLNGTAIYQASNLQKIVILSTTEAKYVAATEARNETIWLHGFLDELGKKKEMGILHSDSKKFGFLFKVEAYINKIPLYPLLF